MVSIDVAVINGNRGGNVNLMIRVAIGLLFVGGAGLAKSTVAAGTVVDGTGAALPGAHVRLERPPVIKQTVTDALGNFSIEGLQEGQWNVTITKPGWEPARRSIDLLEGAPVSLNVQMEPEVLRQAIDVTESAGYLVQTAEFSTKMDIALRDLPQAVQVLPSQLLKEQAALSMQDALRNASGVSVHMGEGRRDQVYVRGFSAVNDQYVDGIRDDAPYYRDLSNIEQIEVLKGPGSVLFGRGSSGGIINRTTKRPNPERPIMEAGVTIGSYGTKRVTGDLGRAQWDGKLAWRLTGAGEESGSHRDRYYLNRYTFAPSVAWTPDQATQLLFQGEHLNDERLPDRGIPSFEGRPAPVRVGAYYGAPIGDALRNRVTAGGFTLSHRFTESVSLRNTFRRIGYANTYSNTYPNDVQAIGGVPMVNRGQYNVSQDQENYFNQTDLLAHFSLLGFAHNVLIGMEAGD